MDDPKRKLGRAYGEQDLEAAAVAAAWGFVRGLRDFPRGQLAKRVAYLSSAPNQSINSVARKEQIPRLLARLRRLQATPAASRPATRALDREIRKLEAHAARAETWRRGRPPSEKTLRRSLDYRSVALVEAEMADFYEATYDVARHNRLLGPVEYNTLDSTYLAHCGQMREYVRASRSYRDRLAEGREAGDPPRFVRTGAALAAHPVPPGTFNSTEVGFQYHILASHGVAGQHYPRRAVRRRMGVAENPGAVVTELLNGLPGSEATWNLADKWFASAEAIAAFQEHARRTGSTYLVAAPRSSTMKTIKRVDDTKYAPEALARSIRYQAQAHWRQAHHVEGTYRDYFVAFEWQVSIKNETKTTLFVYYRSPGLNSKGEPREPLWDEPRSYICFFTNAHVTAHNAKAVAERYSSRWNIENFIRDVKHWTSVAPAQNMYARDLTFMLGFALLGLHSLFRNRFQDLDPEWESFSLDKATFFFALHVILLGLLSGD